ncbi:ATP-dependent RNA helicase DbpA [Pelagibaculum spongiae]|uniref:DEAD-box ATP-dependent RNA helicase RhpA n=1 Tax=Pelagibaculum spongiae TaxID=2080658 RepID=A0A2V1GZE0_9GAMM|nr:ATP-dependent RNA helicase DbpA [Pelagibaculum spongiae]PVZ68426.1 ATP-dependent RNA helicase DbpA [Pelagibaculum spongiae]
MSETDFSTLNLHADLLQNLDSLGYHQMTPIQAQSLPAILDGKDVIGQGKTGSGKTAAFGLGLLNKLNVKRFRVQTLVLCPTRELADQVAKELRRLARSIHNIKILTLCGGTPFGPQIGSLEHGAHIIVGTPGRIEEHLRKERLDLSELDTLVLDEADRMLDMGFQESLDVIFGYMPKQRQTLLFSATFPKQIEKIAKDIMSEPVRVEVASTHDDKTITQHFYRVDHHEDRIDAVRSVLLSRQPESAVIFCNTKVETQMVADALHDDGFSVLSLHGDLEQRDRDQTLARFANKSISVLVATDVAARGLDIDSLDAVINYQMAYDPEIHVHRIGRTGRAGSQGIACSIYCENEIRKLISLEDYLGQPIKAEALPAVKSGMEPYRPGMATIRIEGGKKDKVRPGDILGALTGDSGIEGKYVGKIQIFPFYAYVAVAERSVSGALAKLRSGKIKGRHFKIRHVG